LWLVYVAASIHKQGYAAASIAVWLDPVCSAGGSSDGSAVRHRIQIQSGRQAQFVTSKPFKVTHSAIHTLLRAAHCLHQCGTYGALRGADKPAVLLVGAAAAG
jgi:hypothetical protein